MRNTTFHSQIDGERFFFFCRLYVYMFQNKVVKGYMRGRDQIIRDKALELLYYVSQLKLFLYCRRTLKIGCGS